MSGDLTEMDYNLDIMERASNYRRWFLTIFQPYLRGDVVEIGAGIGSNASVTLPWCDALELVEPAPKFVARMQERFLAEPKATIHPCMEEEFYARKPGVMFDAVLMVSFLEHMQDDVGVLQRAAGSLRSGGHLLLFVPALPMLFNQMDARYGHYRRYTMKDLKERVAASGLEIVSGRYMDFFGILPWWLGKWTGADSINPGALYWYDRYIVPVARLLEAGAWWPPVGKNIWLVARRL